MSDKCVHFRASVMFTFQFVTTDYGTINLSAQGGGGGGGLNICLPLSTRHAYLTLASYITESVEKNRLINMTGMLHLASAFQNQRKN